MFMFIRSLVAIKRMLLLTAAAFLSMFLMAGCGSKPAGPPAPAGGGENEITIATSFYPMYIMTLNIAKDIPGVNIVNMTRPVTGCLHDYQLTTEDLKNLEKASILVINGAGMESFMEKLLIQLPEIKVIEASRGIPLIKSEVGEENPHVWVSITHAIQEVKNITEQLIALDPVHADKYYSNSADYVAKLEALRTRMHQELSQINNRDIITFHEAFPYFAEEFGLNIVSVIEREPGSEPSASELADTIKTVKELKVKALFTEPQYPNKAAATIARETDAKVYVLDPAVSGLMEADSYLNIMEENLKTLLEVLN